MPVNVQKYGMAVEKYSKTMDELSKAHKRAVRESTPDKYDKPSYVDTLILDVLKKLKRKNRTKKVVSDIGSGLTPKEIARLKG